MPFTACHQAGSQGKTLDHVFKTVLSDVRLGDGVPISLEMNIRWKIMDRDEFYSQFTSIGQYDTLILQARAMELAAKITNTYDSVDSVFTSKREQFIDEIKTKLQSNLGEDGITVKEIIMSDIIFPSTFTKAMEHVGLRERELENIRLQNTIDIENASAKEEKTKADGQVAIQEAKVEGQVAKINAETEQKRRLSRLAQAETEKQVLELEAQAEAAKKRYLAKADLDEKTDLKNLEIQRQKDVFQLELEHQREIASMIYANPSLASFLVSKELASQVQIALVPMGNDGSVFNEMLTNSLNGDPKVPIMNIDMKQPLEEDK